MTFKELQDTLKYRKEGMAYEWWRQGTIQAQAIACCFSKSNKYPKSPKDMFEGELIERPKGIPMPEFLKEKYYKQKGVRM